MAQTDIPKDWKFVVPVPGIADASQKLSRSWTVGLDRPVSRGGLEFPLTKPLDVTAEIRRLPYGAEMYIQLDGEVATECRRCCAPLTVAIHEGFMYSYILQSEAAETGRDEEEFCDTDAVVIPVPRLGATLDISGLVWECLVEALPLYAQCEGGCLPAGADEPRIDPRFLPLADVLEQEKHKGGK